MFIQQIALDSYYIGYTYGTVKVCVALDEVKGNEFQSPFVGIALRFRALAALYDAAAVESAFGLICQRTSRGRRLDARSEILKCFMRICADDLNFGRYGHRGNTALKSVLFDGFYASGDSKFIKQGDVFERL